MRERDKVFTPFFTCSCVKMAAAVSVSPQPFQLSIWKNVEKNAAHRPYDKSVFVCVIQSRLKCNFCSVSCGTFLNVSMYKHFEIGKTILRIRTYHAHIRLSVCLFVRLSFYTWHYCQQYTTYSIPRIAIPILKYWGKSKSILIVLSWIPCETEIRLRLSIIQSGCSLPLFVLPLSCFYSIQHFRTIL